MLCVIQSSTVSLKMHSTDIEQCEVVQNASDDAAAQVNVATHCTV